MSTGVAAPIRMCAALAAGLWVAVHAGPGRAAGSSSPKPMELDVVTIGLTGGDPIAGNLQFFTVTWKNVQLIVMDFSVGGSFGNRTLSLTVGPTVGVGWHHGHRSRFSHWFITGGWYGEMYLDWFFGYHRYEGLFLPSGYEFRQRWGKNGRAVWGIRAFVAWSPVGRYATSGCGCGGAFCFLCPDPSGRIRAPLMGGVTAFIGR